MSRTDLIQKVAAKAQEYDAQPAEAVLEFLTKTMGHDLVLANSLGPEDVVLTHMLHGIDPGFKSFTLDTGRLNPETYDLMGRLKERYNLDLEITFPDRALVEKMVNQKGINLFYESIEN